MYDFMQQHLYWIHVADDIYNKVSKCMLCAQNCRTNKDQKKLRLFSLAGPLDIFVMHILGPLLKTEDGNKYIVVVADNYSELR